MAWRRSRWAGTFSPGWSHQPGLKVDLYSWLVAPTGSRSLVPASGVARDWKVTFSPGWIHQPGLKVPLYIPAVSFFLPKPEEARAQHILKLTALVFLLPPSIVPPSILRFLRRFFSCKGYQSHTLIFHHWLISYCSLYIYCFYGVFYL